jgi:uroporphyrin-III C-methyltransferase
VVSRALWPDQIASDHTLHSLSAASALHAGRPTLVTVGAGAVPVAGKPLHVDRHQATARGVGP